MTFRSPQRTEKVQMFAKLPCHYQRAICASPHRGWQSRGNVSLDRFGPPVSSLVHSLSAQPQAPVDRALYIALALVYVIPYEIRLVRPVMKRAESPWHVDDQAQRLAEMMAHDAELKDVPLRRDVRSLGRLLGVVLKEQAGTELFDAVERLRLLAIQHRDTQLQGDADAATGGTPDRSELMDFAGRFLGEISVGEAYQLTKAFAIYFELTNLAETNHRKRRRRAAELAPDRSPQPGTLRGTLARMRDSGITAQQAMETLQRVKVIPVFTAHPTEVARRTVLFKRQRIAVELERLDRLPLTDSEADDAAENITAEITALWQADEVRRRKPTVRDEIKMGLDYYRVCLIATVPKVYDEIVDAFRYAYQEDVPESDLPTVVQFGSWTGGDRDGNPYVTPDATEAALEMARRTILDHYIRSIMDLLRQLSPSIGQAPASPEIRTTCPSPLFARDQRRSSNSTSSLEPT